MAVQTPREVTPKGEASPLPSSDKPGKRKPLGIILGGIFIFCLLVFASSTFWERLKNNPDLDRDAVEAAQREAEEIGKNQEEWIQYALVAVTTMKRPCLRCPNGVTIVTVKKDEIYKYGITTQGEARYKRKLYNKLQLRMIEEVAGDYTICRKAEINKILSYQFLPESQKPEVKLMRPPEMPTEIDRKGLFCNKSANNIEPFSDFTFMKSIDLGSKADMSYRLRTLLNEKIDLANYGDVVQCVLISPLIGSVLAPESQYLSQEKQLTVEFDIDPQQAIDLEEAPYFQLMLDSFLQAIEYMNLPKGFDFESFKKDVSALQFEQLQQAA